MSHERPGATNEWYTPAYIFDALECTFDLDVAHPGFPLAFWIPAREIITERSLEKKWDGFIWMNPPFGGRNGIVPWLEKFIRHGNGIALTPDRTSSPWWGRCASRSNAILFISPRVKFIGIDGNIGKSPPQGTSLFACGESGIAALRNAERKGLGTLVYTAAKQL